MKKMNQEMWNKMPEWILILKETYEKEVKGGIKDE